MPTDRDLADPYLALGLRENPFVAEGIAGVPPELWIDRDAPDTPQPETRQFIQVIGVKGAGKTSLLMHWREQQPGPYHYVPPRSGTMPAVADRPDLLLG